MTKVIEFIILIFCIVYACVIIAWLIRSENKPTNNKQKKEKKL